MTAEVQRVDTPGGPAYGLASPEFFHLLRRIEQAESTLRQEVKQTESTLRQEIEQIESTLRQEIK